MIHTSKPEHKDALSLPPSQRAGMVRLMKMALTMLNQAPSAAMKELAQGMVDQLTEIMPELRAVTAWPETVQRR
jgi:hypothetical protein